MTKSSYNSYNAATPLEIQISGGESAGGPSSVSRADYRSYLQKVVLNYSPQATALTTTKLSH